MGRGAREGYPRKDREAETWMRRVGGSQVKAGQPNHKSEP